MTVNIHEAKSSLSKLIIASENGEEVIIARAGKPAVYLKPVEAPVKRVPGRLAGLMEISDEDLMAPVMTEEECQS